MKSREEMRREAWGVLGGKWFMRLLVGVVVLQLIACLANYAVVCSLGAMSITTVGEYAKAWAEAAGQGIKYSLPTTKAYAWMAGGFCLQMFIAYVFGAIAMFGFVGLSLRARDDDAGRWMVRSMSGFSRPFDVAWLMLLMNLLVMLVFVFWAVLFSSIALVLAHLAGMDVFSAAGMAVAALGVFAAIPFSVPAFYAYRQAWYIKCEDESLSAVECLRRSRRMMKGFKASAFLLDLSYLLRFVFSMILYVISSVLAAFAAQGGALVGFASAVVGFLAFYVFVKALLALFVVRAVFYREIQTPDAPAAATPAAATPAAATEEAR